LARTRRGRCEHARDRRLRARPGAAHVPGRRRAGRPRHALERADLDLAPPEGAPFARATARSEEIGIEGSDPADAEAIYVTNLQLPKAGTYWLLAEPVGGRRFQAVGTVVASSSGRPRPTSARLRLRRGRRPSPRRRSTSCRRRARPIRSSTAARSPTRLADRAPFVIVFATPKYCTSRTCGPVVDVVSTVRRDHADSGIRFIHVEIYEDNEPAKGENRWVREWKLPTEPWVFLVGADGKVRDRFEGTVSVRELEASVRQHLLG
jgi:hypothetical protein